MAIVVIVLITAVIASVLLYHKSRSDNTGRNTSNGDNSSNGGNSGSNGGSSNNAGLVSGSTVLVFNSSSLTVNPLNISLNYNYSDNQVEIHVGQTPTFNVVDSSTITRLTSLPDSKLLDLLNSVDRNSLQRTGGFSLYQGYGNFTPYMFSIEKDSNGQGVAVLDFTQNPIIKSSTGDYETGIMGFFCNSQKCYV